jgi:hypothetical protein
MSTMTRVLRALSLTKIAAVDAPCQEPALAAIMKRAPEDLSPGEKIAKGLFEALSKGGFDCCVGDVDATAEDFDAALGEQTVGQQFWSDYYDATRALEESLTSILKDDAVTDKPPMIAQSLQQFAEHVETIMPEQLGKSLAAGIAALAGSTGATVHKGVVMTDELKKALGLEASATDADVMKAIGTLNETAEKAKADAAALEAEKAKKPVEPDGDEVAKMVATGDAFRAIDGSVITKAKAGDLYAVLKSQNDTLAKQADELSKARDREEETSFAKRAIDIGFGPEFGPTLRKAYGGDSAAQIEIEKRILGLQNQAEAGGVFKNFGHNSPAAGSAAEELMAKVEEVKKADPSLTDAQAYTKAYTDPQNADIKKRMKAESQG